MDIITEINERVEKAEAERNSAIDQLKKLKKTLSSKGVEIDDGGNIFVRVGLPEDKGYWWCSKCPFGRWTSAEDIKCKLHKDECKCSDDGARFYTLTEVREMLRKKSDKQARIDKLESELEDFRYAMKKIKDLAENPRNWED